MTPDRVYRKGKSRDAAIAELRNCAGTQFDPAMVERFIEVVLAHEQISTHSTMGISKQTALMIGLQFDRLALALDSRAFGQISLMAGHLASVAADEGAAEIARVAGDLEHAAGEDPELLAAVKLVMELLDTCQSAQRSCLESRPAPPPATDENG
jgi:hypothetical protein